jgi:ATP-dependent protease ClpP protease subunit
LSGEDLQTMKDYILKLLLFGAVAVGLIQFANHSRPDQEFDPDPFVDAFMDSGIEIGDGETASALLEQRKIVLTAGINANFSRTLIGRLVLLDMKSPGTPIDLYLRTEGGWEADAFAVIDTIKSISSPVNVHALGEVHSAGLMMLASATGDRLVYPHTMLGFHGVSGDEDEIYESRYLDFWRGVADLPENWLNEKDAEMEYFSPEDAVKYKVADKIVGAK